MTTKKGHRVIGIRHTLKQFKDAGLVEDEHHYPEEGVDDVQGRIVQTAIRFYKIGARRGAIEAHEAIISGDFDVDEKGGKRSIVANVHEIA